MAESSSDENSSSEDQSSDGEESSDGYEITENDICSICAKPISGRPVCKCEISDTHECKCKTINCNCSDCTSRCQCEGALWEYWYCHLRGTLAHHNCTAVKKRKLCHLISAAEKDYSRDFYKRLWLSGIQPEAVLNDLKAKWQT